MESGEQGSYCPFFHDSIELIGRRWSGAILLALFAELHRYSDLKAAIPGLSDRLLTERLKELETAGLVSRCAETRDVSYGLTEKGRALLPTFDALSAWTAEWAHDQARVGH